MRRVAIPIFPLNGAILFPYTNLPLNIFEERYIDMINFALSNNKTIGMIQLKDDNSFFDIGCVGKINSFSETEDGRFIINLYGQNYFSIIKEVITKAKFRTFEISLINESNQKNNLINLKSFDFNLLIKHYVNFTKKNNLDVDIKFLEKIDKNILIKFIAMSSPFSVPEKQMLLETFNLNDLANKLKILLQYYLAEKENITIN